MKLTEENLAEAVETVFVNDDCSREKLEEARQQYLSAVFSVLNIKGAEPTEEQRKSIDDRLTIAVSFE